MRKQATQLTFDAATIGVKAYAMVAFGFSVGDALYWLKGAAEQAQAGIANCIDAYDQAKGTATRCDAVVVAAQLYQVELPTVTI